MTRPLLAALALAAASGPAAGPALAQSKTGTTIGDFLLIEPSARVAAQGNAGATARTSALDAYYNPGALGFMEGAAAAFSHSPWLADVDYNYAAVAVRLDGRNALSLSVTSLNSGEMDVRTVRQPDGTGAQFSVEDLALGLGYGRRFTERFAAGATVKYVQETILNSATRNVALDAGVIYELPVAGAVLGASLSNFGTKMSFDGTDLRVRYDQDPDTFGDNDNLPAALETDDFALPIFFRVGLSAPVELGPTRVTVSADALQPNNNSFNVSAGAEWTYADLVSARAGYQNLFMEDGEGGLRLGGGLRYDVGGFDFRFDYAWADHGSRLGATQRFTLGLGF